MTNEEAIDRLRRDIGMTRIDPYTGNLKPCLSNDERTLIEAQDMAITLLYKVGRWIKHRHAKIVDGVLVNYECSYCHDWTKEHSNYCPSCGAEMKG